MTTATTPAKRASILVVDDEPAIRELLADALGEQGLEVHLAASGHDALEVVRSKPVDMLVADLRLGDCEGTSLLEQIRRQAGEIPAVIITGVRDAWALAQASASRPCELLTKPLDIDHLGELIQREISRWAHRQRQRRRLRRLRLLARHSNIQRKQALRQLESTCTDLSNAYRSLHDQLAQHRTVMGFQHHLLSARNDDDVFREFFRSFVTQSGPVMGIALACDESAQLNIVGRFGVPGPDSPRFCQLLAGPMIDQALIEPSCTLSDAQQQAEDFDPAIRKFLVGVSVLSAPLCPRNGEMIGLVLLYRKGEQPFTDQDLALAQQLVPAAALAVERNG